MNGECPISVPHAGVWTFAAHKRGLPAVCPPCRNQVIPKFGSQIMHHWAHEANECDPWWEPETEWHRSWKRYVPSEQTEVTRANPRADIVRTDGDDG